MLLSGPTCHRYACSNNELCDHAVAAQQLMGPDAQLKPSGTELAELEGSFKSVFE